MLPAKGSGMDFNMINRKETILIFALNRTPWIGGIYYKKNIINMLLSNQKIKEKFQIMVLVNKSNANVFQSFGSDLKIQECEDGIGVLRGFVEIIKIKSKYNIKYLYPMNPSIVFKVLNITTVSWIPDFQHKHFPEFFSGREIKKRDKIYNLLAKKNTPLVLSSQDAYDDFCEFYKVSNNSIHVVHFTSCIKDELKKISLQEEKAIMQKYKLQPYEYFIVCNQFWKHKNHKIVFDAVEILKKEGNNCKFIFTGELSDRRNPEYIEEIKKVINDEKYKDMIVMVGFVDRKHQLCLMKNARAVIQPSLFEGWGTVVEDAKALGKDILLSDIKVHREQKNRTCIFFDPRDKYDLAKKIVEFHMQDNKLLEDQTSKYTEELANVFVL